MGVGSLSPPLVTSADTATHAQGHGLFPNVAFLKRAQISSGSLPELPPPLQNPSGPLHPLFLEAAAHRFPMRSPLFKAFFSHVFSSGQSKSNHELSSHSPWTSPGFLQVQDGVERGLVHTALPAVSLSALVCPSFLHPRALDT